MTQAELPRSLTVNHATVSRWESGIRRPPHDLTEPLATALAIPANQVEHWFAQVPWLKGDRIGQVPGLKHLLRDRGVGIQAAAEVCGVSVDQMRGWVFDRRTFQREAVEPLARLLGMSREEFLWAARRSTESHAAHGSVMRGAESGPQRGYDAREHWLVVPIGRCSERHVHAQINSRAGQADFPTDFRSRSPESGVASSMVRAADF